MRQSIISAIASLSFIGAFQSSFGGFVRLRVLTRKASNKTKIALRLLSGCSCVVDKPEKKSPATGKRVHARVY